MTLKSRLTALLMVLAGMLASAAALAQCPTITLPTPGPTNSITFGDAISFSVQGLGLNVKSAPGQIDGCIVLATGTNNPNVVGNVPPLPVGPIVADNAYDTNVKGGNNPWFRTGDPVFAPDPGGDGQFAGDTATTWDIRLSALQTLLAGNGLVFFFNHAQEGNGPLADQDLYVWAQVRLVDDQDASRTQYFYVTSVPNITGLNNFGQPSGLPLFGFPTAYTGPQTAATNDYPSVPINADGTCDPTGIGTFPSGAIGTGTGTDACFMVQARGKICAAGGVIVPCNPDGTAPPGATVSNQNTGSDQASNAVIFPEIQAILDSLNMGGYDVMQIDLRMGCRGIPDVTKDKDGNVKKVEETNNGCPPGSILNGGNEQVFIAGLLRDTQVPAPGTLALLALGLLGLATGIRRKYKA